MSVLLKSPAARGMNLSARETAQTLLFWLIVTAMLLPAAPVYSFVHVPQAGEVHLTDIIRERLGEGSAFTPEESEQYASAIQRELGIYARDAVHGERREQALSVLLSVVMEASFDNVPVERTARAASAAYKSVRRGSSPAVVRGLALYGFGRDVSEDMLEAWALGYQSCVASGVPPYIAADLVHAAVEHGWDIYTYNTLRLGLIDAARGGYEAEHVHIYLVGHLLAAEKEPGQMVSETLLYFRQIVRKGENPQLPEYHGTFLPRKPVPVEEDQEADEASPSGQEPSLEGKPELQEVPEPEDAPGSGFFYSSILAKLEATYTSYLGVPYVWRGETRRGTDCPGLVYAVFAEIGVDVPRAILKQWETGTQVAAGELREGDLVFFRIPGSDVSHVGIMVEPRSGRFLRVSPSHGVTFSYLTDRLFRERFAGGRRVIPEGLTEMSLMENSSPPKPSLAGMAGGMGTREQKR
jgi:hypothetical protein